MASPILPIIRPVALYLLVLLSGLLAGIHFYGLLAPVAQKMSATVFVPYWQAVDGYMGQRMPIFGKTFLSVFVLNIVLFSPQWRSAVFGIVAFCFLLYVSDVVVTVRRQVPINQYLQRLPAGPLTAEQEQTITTLKAQGEDTFRVRKVLALVSFALLSVTPFLLNRTPRRVA